MYCIRDSIWNAESSVPNLSWSYIFLQVTFLDFIIYPLWETWAELVYPDAQIILDGLTKTREYWHTQIPYSPPPSDSPDERDSPFDQQTPTAVSFPENTTLSDPAHLEASRSTSPGAQKQTESADVHVQWSNRRSRTLPLESSENSTKHSLPSQLSLNSSWGSNSSPAQERRYACSCAHGIYDIANSFNIALHIVSCSSTALNMYV